MQRRTASSSSPVPLHIPLALHLALPLPLHHSITSSSVCLPWWILFRNRSDLCIFLKNNRHHYHHYYNHQKRVILLLLIETDNKAGSALTPIQNPHLYIPDHLLKETRYLFQEIQCRQDF